MTKQQEERYIQVVNQYRETFRQMKVGYCCSEDMLIVNEIDEYNKMDISREDREQLLFDTFKTNLGLVLKQSMHSISRCFDECFAQVSDLSCTDKVMCNYKMKEIEKTFDSIVATFYKNKVLSVLPDIVFTLEATRFKTALTVSQTYLKLKHKQNLKKGMDALRRNVSRFYISQDKASESKQNIHRGLRTLTRTIGRKTKENLHNCLSVWKDIYKKEQLTEKLQENAFEDSKKLETIEHLSTEISSQNLTLIQAQKCFTYISNFANLCNEEATEEQYQIVLTEILHTFFPNSEFDLKFEEIEQNTVSEEDEGLDYRWIKKGQLRVLNLNKPLPKTHQYRVYFRNADSVPVNPPTLLVKLLTNTLSWIKTLKGMNSLLIDEEVYPLRQDCKTLTIVNNVRSILEESNIVCDFEGTEVINYLEDVSSKIFAAVHLNTHVQVFESEQYQEKQYKRQDRHGQYKTALGEQRQTQNDENEEFNVDTNIDELGITFTSEMIVLRWDSLVVEAKILEEGSVVEEQKEFSHSFNPTDQSRQEDYYDDIPINETTKNFVFKLLKSFIESFYTKSIERKEILEREEEQEQKISEYSNELRLLKDWNQFLLTTMNRPTIMDTYENCVISIEKYLICEIAKSTPVEDLCILHTYDYEYLLKIKSGKEFVYEEVSSDLSKKLKSHLTDNPEFETTTTKCVSILCNDIEHYFLIKTEEGHNEGVSFMIKLTYKQEQEGVVTMNTLQILSSVILTTLNHFLNQFYMDTGNVTRNQVFQGLMHLQTITENDHKRSRMEIMDIADNYWKGIEILEDVGTTFPQRISFNRIKIFAFRTRKMIKLDSLCTILNKENLKYAFKKWTNSLILWKKKLISIKKLLQWNKMKLTSKVLNKWYNQYKYEESIMHSVCHRDYIISMYEILGNTQNSKQFTEKYQTVFAFMINRYLKQWLPNKLKHGLKKIVLALKKDKSTFIMIDFSEEEKQKSNNKFISPIKNKNLPEYVSAIVSNMSSPSNSGRITPINQQMFIEDQDFLNPVSPQNYSFILNSNKNPKKAHLSKLDINCDYILRQCFENPQCLKITNHSILFESLTNRLQSKEEAVNSSKYINCWIVVPVCGTEDLEIDEDMEKNFNSGHTLELYFSDANKNTELNDVTEKSLSALFPIFNLLRDILLSDTKFNPPSRNNSQSPRGRNINRTFDHGHGLNDTTEIMDESKASISASFLEANQKTYQDNLMCFTQASKLQRSFSNLMNFTNHEVTKILRCEKVVVISIVEGLNNMFGGSTKLAYFYSFTERLGLTSKTDWMIYNFNYDGTFVEKILDTNKPVCFTVPNQQMCLPASIKNTGYAHYPKNIANESYHTIRYLPVSITKNGSSEIVAILETCYSDINASALFTTEHDHSYISENAEEDEKLISILDQNTSLLSGFAEACGKSEVSESKISPTHKNLEFQCTKIIGKRMKKHRVNLKFLTKTVKKCLKNLEKFVIKNKFNRWKVETTRFKDMEISQFQKEIEAKEGVIVDLQQKNEKLNNDLTNVNGRFYDHKNYKGSMKILLVVLKKALANGNIARAFEIWKADMEVNRIMENAFNKVLEMRHDNVCDKVSSGVNLLGYVFNKRLRGALYELHSQESSFFMTKNRSPTPKFNHWNLIDEEEYSASLHDSTLFLSRCQDKQRKSKERRKKTKSHENNTFMF